MHTVCSRAWAATCSRAGFRLRGARAQRPSEVIREAIIDGRLAPGQRLKEEELARELGISRTPVREALLILESEGLVESIPKRGATVRSYAVDDLDDLYQLRALLEGYAARRAADAHLARRTSCACEESCDRFDRLRAEDDLLDLVKENLFFHNVILEAAGERPARRDGPQGDRDPARLQVVPLVLAGAEADLRSTTTGSSTRALAGGDAERAELIMKEHVLEARDFLARAAPSRRRKRAARMTRA